MRSRLRPYFPGDLLETVSTVQVDATPQLPLHEWSLASPVDFVGTGASGLSLLDLVFLRYGGEDRADLLFHELVHAMQWRCLGLNRFLLLYGIGLVQHGYRQSPLEAMAFDLQHRFEREDAPFDAGMLTTRRCQELLASVRSSTCVLRVALTILR